MTRRWPDSLPDPFTPDSDVIGIEPVLRSDFDTGQRARRLVRAAGQRATLTARLSGAEKTALDAWWADAAWSLAGSSDSLADWTIDGFARDAGAVTGPDEVICDMLTIDGTTGIHRVRRALDSWGWGDGDAAGIVLSAHGEAGIARLQAGIVGRDGTLRAAAIDLAAGGILGVDSGVTARVVEHRGGWRLTVSAPVGSGAADPIAHIAALDGDGSASFEGDGVSRLYLSQINAMADEGAVVFLPAASDGTARGAGGGAGWWYVPFLAGHRYLRREVQAAGPLEAAPLAGMNWSVRLPVMVRDA